MAVVWHRVSYFVIKKVTPQRLEFSAFVGSWCFCVVLLQDVRMHAFAEPPDAL